MSKIKINYNLNDNKKEILGIKNKERITFKDSDVTFNIILKDNLILERKAEDYKLIIDLNKKQATYELIGIGTFNLDIKLIKIKKEENYIYIKYKLNEKIFEFEISYEVIE